MIINIRQLTLQNDPEIIIYYRYYTETSFNKATMATALSLWNRFK